MPEGKESKRSESKRSVESKKSSKVAPEAEEEPEQVEEEVGDETAVDVAPEGTDGGAEDNITESETSSTTETSAKKKRRKRMKEKKIPMTREEKAYKKAQKRLMKQHMVQQGRWHAALLEDCEEGDTKSVENVLDYGGCREGDLSEIVDSRGRTALMIAAAAANTETVQLLIEFANSAKRTETKEFVRARDHTNNTALMLACKNMNNKDEQVLEIVNILIENGATQNVRQKETGMTCLHWACYNALPVVAKALMTADPSQTRQVNARGVLPVTQAGQVLLTLRQRAAASPFDAYRRQRREIDQLKSLVDKVAKAMVDYCAESDDKERANRERDAKEMEEMKGLSGAKLAAAKARRMRRKVQEDAAAAKARAAEAKAATVDAMEDLTDAFGISLNLNVGAAERNQLLGEALFWCTVSGNKEEIARILEMENIDITDSRGHNTTPVHAAAMFGYVDLLNKFIAERKQIEDETTAKMREKERLQYRLQMGHDPPKPKPPTAAELALESRKRWSQLLDIIDAKGNSPLHCAVWMANAAVAPGVPAWSLGATSETVDTLIANGARPQLLNFSLLTPVNYMSTRLKKMLKTPVSALTGSTQLPDVYAEAASKEEMSQLHVADTADADADAELAAASLDAGRGDDSDSEEEAEGKVFQQKLIKRLLTNRVTPSRALGHIGVDRSIAEKAKGVEKWRTDFIMIFDAFRVASMFKVKAALEKVNLVVQPVALAKRDPSTDELGPHGLVYMLVMGPDPVLRAASAKFKYRRSLVMHARMVPFQPDRDHCYTPLRNKDRQLLVLELMQEVFDVRDYCSSGIIKAMFPQHSKIQARLLHMIWTRTWCCGLLSHPFGSFGDYFGDSKHLQHVKLIASYFGVRFGFYFAWLSFYTAWLLPASFFGILGVVWTIVRLTWGLPYHQALDSEAHVLVSIFMMIWATCFMESWHRKCSELVFIWDMGQYKNQEKIRPEFEGDETVSHVTEEIIASFPNAKRLPREITGGTVLLTLGTIAVAIVIGIKQYKAVYGAFIGIENDTLAQTIAGFVQGFLISALNAIYTKLARYFTNWENHRTQTQHDDMLIMKIFLFQFVNSYTAVLFSIFWDQDIGGVAIKVATVLISKTGLDMFTEVGLPFWKVRGRIRKARRLFNESERDMSVMHDYSHYLACHTSREMGSQAPSWLAQIRQGVGGDAKSAMEAEILAKQTEIVDKADAKDAAKAAKKARRDERRAERKAKKAQAKKDKAGAGAGEAEAEGEADAEPKDKDADEEQQEELPASGETKEAPADEETEEASTEKKPEGEGEGEGGGEGEPDAAAEAETEAEAEAAAEGGGGGGAGAGSGGGGGGDGDGDGNGAEEIFGVLGGSSGVSYFDAMNKALAAPNIAKPRRRDLYKALENDQMLPSSGTVSEYTEMVIQFGYIAMFTASFPLAPLLAMVVNMFELRSDVRKFCFVQRRAMAEGATGIGSYTLILEGLIFFATIINCGQIYYVSSGLATFANVASNGRSCQKLDVHDLRLAQLAWNTPNITNATALAGAVAGVGGKNASLLDVFAPAAPGSAPSFLNATATMNASNASMLLNSTVAGTAQAVCDAAVTALIFNRTDGKLGLPDEDNIRACGMCTGIHCWYQLALIVVLEHIMIFLRLILMTTLPNQADWVNNMLRQRHHMDQLLDASASKAARRGKVMGATRTDTGKSKAMEAADGSVLTETEKNELHWSVVRIQQLFFKKLYRSQQRRLKKMQEEMAKLVGVRQKVELVNKRAAALTAQRAMGGAAARGGDREGAGDETKPSETRPESKVGGKSESKSGGKD